LNSRSEFVNRLFVVFEPGRLLPGEPRGAALHVVASALDLVDERPHVRREPTVHKHVDIELLGGRVLLGLAQPSRWS